MGHRCGDAADARALARGRSEMARASDLMGRRSAGGLRAPRARRPPRDALVSILAAALLAAASLAFSPDGWRVVEVPKARPAQVELVDDGGTKVLRVRSENAAGAAARA